MRIMSEDQYIYVSYLRNSHPYIYESALDHFDAVDDEEISV